MHICESEPEHDIASPELPNILLFSEDCLPLSCYQRCFIMSGSKRASYDSLTSSILEAEMMGFDQNENITNSLSRRSSESDLHAQPKKSNTIFTGAVRRIMADNIKRKADKDILQQVLKEIETVSAKRMKEGLNQWNFSVGVFNCFFIVYIFGKKHVLLYHFLMLMQSLSFVRLILTPHLHPCNSSHTIQERIQSIYGSST